MNSSEVAVTSANRCTGSRMGSPPSLAEMEMTGRLRGLSINIMNASDCDIGIGCFSDEESEAKLDMFSGSQIVSISFTPTHHSKIDYCSMPINSTLRFSSVPVSQRILTSSPAFLSPNSLLLASSPEFSHHLTPSPTWDGDHIVSTEASEIVEWERGSTSLEELFEAETRKEDQSFSEYGDDCFTKSADFSGFSNSNWNSNSSYSSHQTTLWDLLRSDTQDCPQLRSCHKRKSLSWKGMIQALTSKSKRNLFSIACNKNSTPQCQPQLTLPASQVCYLSARSTQQVARLRKRRCVPYRRQIISFFSCIKPG